MIGNGLDVPVCIESGRPVSVKRLRNGIPAYQQMNMFNWLETWLLDAVTITILLEPKNPHLAYTSYLCRLSIW